MTVSVSALRRREDDSLELRASESHQSRVINTVGCRDWTHSLTYYIHEQETKRHSDKRLFPRNVDLLGDDHDLESVHLTSNEVPRASKVDLIKWPPTAFTFPADFLSLPRESAPASGGISRHVGAREVHRSLFINSGTPLVAAVKRRRAEKPRYFRSLLPADSQ